MQKKILNRNIQNFDKNILLPTSITPKLIDRPRDIIFNFFLTKAINLAMSSRAMLSDGCEVWKYNYTTQGWKQLIGEQTLADYPSGFGDKNNLAASVMKVFNNDLYVGTWTCPKKGCEIWRYNGVNWEQLVGKGASTPGGFGESYNIGAWCIEEFKNNLYIGTMNWDFTDKGGCQVWRTKDGTSWEKVVDRGFRDFLNDEQQNVHNTYAWSMKVYHDQLYVGTFKTNSIFGFSNCGCQLFRTSDGNLWEKVPLPGGDGFCEEKNYGIRSLEVYNNELYVGTATDAYQMDGADVQACEIWKFDGEQWTELIGDSLTGEFETDGFGSRFNKYIWSICTTSDNLLWVGTLNMQIKLDDRNTTYGCEVWCFNGTSWIPVVKDLYGEISSGFGDIYNIGARSIIEYPPGSGNVVISTYTMKQPYQPVQGCNVWIRYKDI